MLEEARIVVDSRPQALAEMAIIRQGAVPVVREADADRAYSTCARLIATGLDVIELTATTPGWRDVLGSLVRDFPDAIVGMGTIATEEDAIAACDLGAQFIVSPFPADEARQATTGTDTLFIGGGFSPGEVAASSRFGLAKLFPAHVGGVAYLKTLRAILPDARIMPTGGIGIADVSRWLEAGAVAVGIGGEISRAADLEAAVAELLHQVNEGRRS